MTGALRFLVGLLAGAAIGLWLASLRARFWRDRSDHWLSRCLALEGELTTVKYRGAPHQKPPSRSFVSVRREGAVIKTPEFDVYRRVIPGERT